jgi:hypothetical protein
VRRQARRVARHGGLDLRLARGNHARVEVHLLFISKKNLNTS